MEHQKDSELNRLIDGFSLVEPEVALRLKELFLQKMVLNELTRKAWVQSLDLSVESTDEHAEDHRVIELSEHVLFEKWKERFIQVAVQEAAVFFENESAFYGQLKAMVSHSDVITRLLFEEIDHGRWQFFSFRIAEWMDGLWAMVTIPLSASRVPPEVEWAKKVQDHPSLLMVPQAMKKLGVLQSGEDYRVVYCQSFQRHASWMQNSINRLLRASENSFQSDILNALYPERAALLPYGTDKTYVVRPPLLLELPEWAKRHDLFDFWE